tara:strand:+ start:9359 stop:9514 length:156 start_codon:yes stop_codon:yes gene_type:complete
MNNKNHIIGTLCKFINKEMKMHAGDPRITELQKEIDHKNKQQTTNNKQYGI